MGVAAGKNDFESGLTLEFDAANSKSYSGSGTTWYDISGNNNNGTLTNGPTYSYTNGGAIYFDGTNDYVSTSYTLSNTCSVSIWFYNDLTYNANNRGLFSTFSTGSFNGMYIGTTTAASNSMRIWYDSNSYALINYSFLINTWYNIIVTSSGSQILIYVNGVLANTISGSTTHADVLNVGRTKFDTNYWSGYIANFQVFNRAIGSSEVQQIFTSQRPNPSPVIDSTLALYLDAANPRSYPGTGTTWYDLSLNGKNGTLVSSSQYNTAGYMQYSGATVNTETVVSSVSMNTSTGNTVEQWVYLDSRQANGNMPFTFYNVSLDFWTYNNTFGINNSSSLIYGIASSDAYLVGKWCHVVFYVPYNWSAAYASAKMWLNGVAQSMSVQAGSLANATISSSQTISIGGGYTSGADDYNWNGRISLTRIYNRELTSNEVVQNFNAARARFGV